MNYFRCFTTIIYTCFLWVIVKCKDYPLKVTPELIHVRQGENIEAECMVKDNFPTTYSFGWNLDKKNGTAVEVSTAGNVKILRIQNVNQHDAGTYRCQLSTEERNIVKILKIIVTGTDSIYIACKGSYQCRDGRLINCHLRCDGRVDCPYGDDEKGCSKTKEIYPKEQDPEDDHTAWLKTTVYTVIACTVGVVLFISIVVIAVCRIKMKRAAVRRAMHQAERRRRHGHHSSECHGSSNSTRAQRNNAVEHEPFISAPSPTHFGNIIVNVNNGVQYVPNVDFHTIIQAPPTYQDVLAENQREALIGRHSPPPIYSTIDRNPYRLSCEVRDVANTQLTENGSGDTDTNTNGTNRNESNQASETASSSDRSGETSRSNGERTSVVDIRRNNVPITTSDNNFQASQSVINSCRDGTRSLERLCRNRQGGSRSRPNVRSVAAPRRPKQLQVRGGQIVLDENSSASSSPETVNRNTQTNPADISQSNNVNSTPANQNTDTQRVQRDITPPTGNNNVSSPTQNKPAQLRVQAGQIMLEGQSDVQALMTSSVTNDPDGAASGQGHLEVKDGHIVFKTP